MPLATPSLQVRIIPKAASPQTLAARAAIPHRDPFHSTARHLAQDKNIGKHVAQKGQEQGQGLCQKHPPQGHLQSPVITGLASAEQYVDAYVRRFLPQLLTHLQQ